MARFSLILMLLLCTSGCYFMHDSMGIFHDPPNNFTCARPWIIKVTFYSDPRNEQINLTEVSQTFVLNFRSSSSDIFCAVPMTVERVEHAIGKVFLKAEIPLNCDNIEYVEYFMDFLTRGDIYHKTKSYRIPVHQ